MPTPNVAHNEKNESLMPPGKLLFTIEDTADILTMSTKSVGRLIERGLLKTNPALRVKLLTRESIEAFAKMTLSSTSPVQN